MKTPKQIQDSTMLALYAFAATLVLTATYLIGAFFVFLKNYLT